MTISIIIPAHNESKSIRKCLEACRNQTRPPDQIVVINDGSTDDTATILQEFDASDIDIIELSAPSGSKSYAQQIGMRYVTGDVFIMTDADTRLHTDYVAVIEERFADKNISAVAGKVASLRHNWLTAARSFEYAIGQNLHKQAQGHLNSILVIPGASSAFRTVDFREYITFDHDTITEDLDFTYKLHKQNKRIVYEPRALVYTQDPTSFSSYANQVRRWVRGGWQNLRKHSDIMKKKPRIFFELSLTYSEGLIFSLALFILPVVTPELYLKVLLALELIVALQVIYTARLERRLDILPVILYYPFLMYLNSYIFLEQFLSVIVFGNKNLVWFQPERIEL